MDEKRHTIKGARERGITRAVTFREGDGFRWMLATSEGRYMDRKDYPTREEARTAMLAAVSQ